MGCVVLANNIMWSNKKWSKIVIHKNKVLFLHVPYFQFAVSVHLVGCLMSFHGVVYLWMVFICYIYIYISSVLYLMTALPHWYTAVISSARITTGEGLLIPSWKWYTTKPHSESSLCSEIMPSSSHCQPGGRLIKKDGLTRYGDSHVKDKTS